MVGLRRVSLQQVRTRNGAHPDNEETYRKDAAAVDDNDNDGYDDDEERLLWNDSDEFPLQQGCVLSPDSDETFS